MNYSASLIKKVIPLYLQPLCWPNHELADGHTIGQNTAAYEEEVEVREGVLHGLSLAYGVPQGHPYLPSLLVGGSHHHIQVHSPRGKILYTNMEYT